MWTANQEFGSAWSFNTSFACFTRKTTTIEYSLEFPSMPRICLKPPWVRTRSKVWAVKHTMSCNVQGDSNKDRRERERDTLKSRTSFFLCTHAQVCFVIIFHKKNILRYNWKDWARIYFYILCGNFEFKTYTSDGNTMQRNTMKICSQLGRGERPSFCCFFFKDSLNNLTS